MKTSAAALRIQADDTYQQVAAEPARYGPETARLVDLARAAGDPEALVAALRAEAWFERLTMHHQRALELLNEAARVARRHGLTDRLAQVLTSRGAVAHELGRLPAAQRDFDRASALRGPVLDVDLAVQQAALLQNTGRYSAAAELYRAILEQPGTPPLARAKAANNLGIIEADSGRYAAALASFETSLRAAEQVGPAAVAMATEGLAWGTVQAGRLPDGLALYESALRSWAAAGMPPVEFYADYADVLADLHLLPEATERARRALEFLDGHGLHLMAAEAQLRCARLAVLTGDSTEAVAAAEAAATQLQAQGRASWAARARLVAVEARLQAGTSRPSDVAAAVRATGVLERAGMRATAVGAHLVAGRAAAALGRPRMAVASWTQAYDLARRGPVLVRVRGRLAAALAARAGDRPDAVLRHARTGLADLAVHRAALASVELRALASAHGAELGSLGLATLLRDGSPGRVLQWMERTRAAALTVVDPVPLTGIEDEVLALRALQVQIQRARADGRPEPAELLDRLAAVEGRIRRQAWQRAAGSPGAGTFRPPSLVELREALAGSPLVEYDVLDGRVIAAVLGPRRTRLVRLVELGDVRKRLAWFLFSLRRLTRPDARPAAVEAARAMAGTALRELRELLVTPLGLPPDRCAVVSPVRDLQRLPWAALLDQPVSVVPSAALWLRSRQRRPPAGGRVALVAGPALPGALAEVAELTALYPDPVVLVPPDSRVEDVVRALDGAALAHLACHGLIREDNPTFSSLQLSDGHLTLHELAQWAVPPHRLVLAACRSGREVGYAGNETLGFVGTLLGRGTAGLVASTVDVPDLASTPLLRMLHSALPAHGSLAAALHAARAGVDNAEPAEFAAWCSFTAYGAA